MTPRRSPLPLLLLALVVLVAPGCLIVKRHKGRDVASDQELALELEVGETTKTQALERLGAPMSIRRQFDGDLLLWQRVFEESAQLVIIPVFTVYLDSEGSSRSDRLALLFDHDGVLSGIGVDRDILRDGKGRPIKARGAD